jgi:predicted membrane-bound spermidine synthase
MKTVQGLLADAIAHPRRLFLFDGLGALLTAGLLALVLAPREPLFGMPRPVLHILALVALIFSAYSLTAFFLVKRPWRPFLLAIAGANLAYCLVTLGLAVHFSEQLTVWGWSYFLGEALVVFALVAFEAATVFKSR